MRPRTLVRPICVYGVCTYMTGLEKRRQTLEQKKQVNAKSIIKTETHTSTRDLDGYTSNIAVILAEGPVQQRF